MLRRFLPLLCTAAGLGISLTLSRAAVGPSSRENAFRSDAGLRPSSDVEEQANALRQSLFKKPFIPLAEPRSQPAVAKRAPVAPPKARTPVIVPPPAQMPEKSLAERELSLQLAADTPYDRYSGSVREVISRLDQRPVNMLRARELMSVAHDFRYRSGHPYFAALPEKTEATRAGDCKAKSLWLYDQLGDPSALYVIGKTFRGAKSNHAWLYWRYDSHWWILDPTNRSAPVLASSFPEDRYVPYYSFGKKGAYRHPQTWIGLAQFAPAVATPSTPGTSGGKPRVARR